MRASFRGQHEWSKCTLDAILSRVGRTALIGGTVSLELSVYPNANAGAGYR
jgi:hypothetical protein